MVKPILSLSFLIFLLSILPLSLFGDWDAHWKFWNSFDGLEESLSSTVTVSPDGDVLINHGDVKRFSYLNGYHIVTYPTPSSRVKIFKSSSGTFWSINPNGLLYFEKDVWRAVPIPGVNGLNVSFYPLPNDNVVMALPERILIVARNPNTTTEIKNNRDAQIGKFVEILLNDRGAGWILGTEGVAKLKIENSSLVEWKEHRSSDSPFAAFLNPKFGVNGNILLSAVSKESANRVLVQFDGAEWQKLYSSEQGNVIRGWLGSDQSLWAQMQDDTLVHILKNTPMEFFPPNVYYGSIYDVASCPDGTFWIASDKGISRYAPILWSDFNDLAGISTAVNSIIPDKMGRIWFDCGHRLMVLDHGEWSSYPYPYGVNSSRVHSNSLCLLYDGRIAIPLSRPMPYLLLFDPYTKRFQKVSVPGLATMIALANDGGLLVQLEDESNKNSDMAVRIDYFNGDRIQPYLERIRDNNFSNLYTILEVKDGSIWFGGENGLTVFRNGEYRTYTEQDGFKDRSAYVIQQLSNNRIWVGGERMILEYDGTTWSVIYSGFDRVQQIYEHSDGTIWVCAASGLYCFSKGNWVNLSKGKELPFFAVNSIGYDARCRFWVGSNMGVNLFDTLADTEPPETFIDYEKNSREIAPGGDVRIVYEGIDKWKQTPSDELLFSYRLDSGGWSPFTNNQYATYSRITPGKHRFEVRSMDRNMNVDDTPPVFTFTVLPSLFQSPSFLLFLACVIISFVIFTIQAIYHTLKRERLLHQLQLSQTQIKQLSGLLPICSSCKKIRDDRGYWNQLEAYIQEHTDAEFSHSFCPDCVKRLYPHLYDKIRHNPENGGENS